MLHAVSHSDLLAVVVLIVVVEIGIFSDGTSTNFSPPDSTDITHSSEARGAFVIIGVELYSARRT